VHTADHTCDDPIHEHRSQTVTQANETAATTEDKDLRDRLVTRLQNRRVELDAFLDKARPRTQLLGITSSVASGLAAVLTAGPAVGGEGFAESTQGVLGFASSTSVWRLLCLFALLVSVVSAICSNLMRSQQGTVQITAAQQAAAELEGLQTMLEFGDVKLEAALKAYQQSIVNTSCVDENLAPKP
jgi:hypothetical protein